MTEGAVPLFVVNRCDSWPHDRCATCADSLSKQCLTCRGSVVVRGGRHDLRSDRQEAHESVKAMRKGRLSWRSTEGMSYQSHAGTGRGKPHLPDLAEAGARAHFRAGHIALGRYLGSCRTIPQSRLFTLRQKERQHAVQELDLCGAGVRICSECLPSKKKNAPTLVHGARRHFPLEQSYRVARNNSGMHPSPQLPKSGGSSF